MNNPQPKRHIDDLSEAEQIEVLTKMKAFLLDALLEAVAKKSIATEKLPDDVKRQIATHTPSNVNWNSAPVAVAPLDAVSVLEEADRIISGCCPACGSSNVQSSTQNGVSIYTCVDCTHEWEG